MSQLQVTGEAKIRDLQGPVVSNSGVISALDGDASQYVRGDGTLADFPTSTGGGSSVSYYLNSSVSQGTIGGVAYRELSKEPIIGAGTDIAISANGYVANYITDVNDPDVILIPGGNFNCEFYFSVNNNSGNPFFYAELYKYDGTTFTLLGSSVGVPEYITQGTTIAPYYFAIPVATATLALTDRLAIRIYVNVSGRTITLHTENGHLCQVVTTLSKGMVSLNNLTDQSQYLTTGTSGTNFAIVSSGDTHTFNLPVASATNTGKLSSTDWSTFNSKYNLPSLTSGSVLFSNGTTIAQNNTNFFWDNTNSFLGVGTNVPSAGITSFSSTPAFQFKAAGVAPAITFSDTLTAATYAAVFGLATSNNQFVFGTATGDFAIANQSTSAGAIVFGTGTTEKMRMTSAGTFSIGNTNSTYKLDVTGTVRFTGELTGSSAVFSSTVRPSSSFGADLGTSSFRWNDIYGFSLTLTSSVTALSIIKSGGTSSQFLMADGSVNTSVLPSGAYLPLTGGTLTGALSGTSATFSGSVGVNSTIRSTGQTDPTSGVGMELFYRAADTSSYIQSYDRTNGAWRDVKIYGNTLYFGSQGNNNLTINTSGNVGIGTSTPSSVLSSRISTITAGNSPASSGTTPVNGVADFTTNRGSGLYIGGQYSSAYAMWLQVSDTGNLGVNYSLLLNPNGGSVGIGTTSPSAMLDVKGTSTYDSIKISNGSSTGGGSLLTLQNNVINSYFGNTGGWEGTTSNETGIGSFTGGIRFYTNGSTEKMRITSGGEVCIGRTSTPSGSYKFAYTGSGGLWVTTNGGGDASYVSQTTSNPFHYYALSTSAVFYVATNGQIYSTSTSITAISDIRHKENIRPLETGLAEILQLKPSRFDWKKGKGTGKKDVAGFIAQDIEEVLPDLVDEWKETMDATESFKSIRMGDLIPTLVKAIQELNQKGQEQQAQIEELKAKIK